jgi:hypothetical protein
MNLTVDATDLERFRGCLLGGAVGDALGAPVEFMSLEEVRRRFGTDGVTGMVPGVWPAGSITDDTQMTLFTADGLLRAQVRWAGKGICHPPTVVDRAYARWLTTQGESSGRWDDRPEDGGEPAIPREWLAQLELRQAITQVAEDLYRCSRGEHWEPEQEWERYPGW